MSKLKVVLNREGVRQLLTSSEMMAICREHADAAVNSLGPGYEVSTHTGKNRVNASIIATDEEAIRENLENNTVLKALR